MKQRSSLSSPHRVAWAKYLGPVVLGTVVSAVSWAAEPIVLPPRAPTPPITARPGDLFEDVTQRAGIGFVQQFCHRGIMNILLSNGSGGAVFDYDGDGLVDIYLLNWGPLEGVTGEPAGTPREPNRLYRNNGDGTFEDVTAKAGLAGNSYASAACVGDIDNDGHPDLFIAGIGRNQLYRNRGAGTFEDVTDRAGVASDRAGISATFVDVDNDGLLDLYVCNYLTYIPDRASEQNPGAYPGPLAYAGQANVLYRNRGDGTFVDVTRESGLYSPGQRGMAVTAFDCDRDGDADLYVSNDDTPNQLWLNDGKGYFREIGVEAGVAFNSIGEAPGSMNAAIGDVDGDGLADIFVTRLGYGSLYARTKQGLYDDRMWASGLGRLTQKYVGWGGEFLDYDNDGDLDIVVANGSAFVLDGTDTLLLANDGRGNFTDASAAGGAFFTAPVNGRGNAALDYDNDGRVDFLIAELADRAFLLRNRATTANHWLKLELEGTKSNRSGYGALLTLMVGDLTLHSEMRSPTGFLTQSDARPHFGLGARKKVDRLEIHWPSGRVQVLTDIPADQILKVKEPQS